MKVQLKVNAPIRISKSVTDIVFSSKLMIDLDCSQCCRCNRSVVLDKTGYFSYCTPKNHNFMGKIRELKSWRSSDRSIVTGEYVVEYEYESFTDKKYPDRIPSKDSTWARVKFFLRCECGANTKHETQNNMVRPIDIQCECGVLLARETKEIPIIEEVPVPVT